MVAYLLKNPKIHDATLLVHHQGKQLIQQFKGGMTSDSPFAIASISKLYTYVLIFQLIDAHKLYYHTKIANLFPKSVLTKLPHSQEITIRHLVDHTSGFANYEMDRQPNGQILFEEVLEQDRAVDFNQALEILQQLPPRFSPGEKDKAYYSHINALLLGKIAEISTGQSLQELLSNRITKPLELNHTHYITPATQLAPIYNKSQTAECLQYLSSQLAQGGLVTINTELMIFTQAFFTGRLFNPKHIIDPIFRKIQWKPMHYGSGMMRLAVPRILSPFIPAPEILGHSGATGSFSYYCPSREVFVTGTVNQIAYRPYSIIYRAIAMASKH